MIREVQIKDVDAITDIYNYYVLNTSISFETESVTKDEMKRRISEISSKFPYLVYEENGNLIGYCYVHLWKTRAAYSHTVETTIYISNEFQHKGIGRQLMATLIEECKKKEFRILIACITDENLKSCKFHEEMGFKQVSHFEKVGFKFGRWLGVVDYELIL
jgi:L-amino acid N-acyltransferase YncA